MRSKDFLSEEIIITSDKLSSMNEFIKSGEESESSNATLSKCKKIFNKFF